MVVLVAFATRHGATAGIAEHIASALRRSGLGAEALAVKAVHDVRAYDAVILGGAAYLSHWHEDAADFARSYRVALRERPVWLFSSGPLGMDPADEDGADVLQTCRPEEFRELSALVHARGTKVFFGAHDGDRPVTVGERLFSLLPAARAGPPSGDVRDWPAIDTWAEEIAAALTCEHTGLQSLEARGGAPRHAPRLDA
jgi:menaquinone-dependent protoporphyrinogen oxidase